MRANRKIVPIAESPRSFDDQGFNWRHIAYLLFVSRTMDRIEERQLVPGKEVLYQFSARGHDLAQIILGSLLTGQHDAVAGYYRSRPLMLALGLSLEDAMAGPLMRAGGYSDGRDIGVVHNLPNLNGPCGLPMSGGVGAQYTPVAGWAQSIHYYRRELNDDSYRGCVAVAHGGEASTATNGFWSSLNIATTLKLPMLFYVEDNGYGISVTSDKQTPGRNIAANLAAFNNLKVLDGDGSDPSESSHLVKQAIEHLRDDRGPVLLRLRVPRLSGHSAQDTQAYKSREQISIEQARDPLPKLKAYLVDQLLNEAEWLEIETQAEADVADALEKAHARPLPEAHDILRHVFCETRGDGTPDLQIQGGLAPGGFHFPPDTTTPAPEPTRVNMVSAIRRTLDHELEINNRLLVFGEDVAAKGGVHAVTMGLADKYGEERVFDTSLSEEGIIGRSIGMAQAGLMPVPEIQFRKYADPAEEQLNDTGTMRWRTKNRFAAPMVVRIAGGFFKCGDPWHSQCQEVKWAHAIGWQVAMPSNAEDAVGLLRSALRSNNPTIFFEHRAMLDDAWARRPYPGDGYVVPFGQARVIKPGEALTLITWGAMVPRCESAAQDFGDQVEVIDLRTIVPWDRERVTQSVTKTGRCLLVHEDNITAGFGAEIAAFLSDSLFFELDAPIKRLAMPDIPSPHSPLLLNSVLPDEQKISTAIDELLGV
ncbi:alpha-ketoacid dehydrogenase subunit alpha/beta [Sedimenticola sp.]|uniref:alpha-ketoacid dehydrogenase subunit alpha/beta n=1 Tax=Sedimenticola sp. TaxID=1940285 RepID=UPI003D131537